jgi:cyclic pyranopterin phosphate synthase
VGKSLSILGAEPPRTLAEAPEAFQEGQLSPLVDARGRHYTYLRLSVTDRCDLACIYCMPPSGEEDHALRPELLSFEEIARLVRVAARMGVERVRFTGGEPLVRRDLVGLIDLVRQETGLSRLVMTTNGTRLAELAAPLAKAGLSGVNVSLDTLHPVRFRELTRGGDVSRVIAGIEAAQAEGLEVKLNAVALGGLNDQDAGELVDWAWQRSITPRFIELMPLGEAASLPKERFLSQSELIARLGERVEERGAGAHIVGQGPARYLSAKDGSGRRVGFITAVSNDFCDSCNRVRITARGEIRACLASRVSVSLRDVMRGGGDDRQLAWALHHALGTKSAGHFFGDPEVREHTHVGMSLIGG